jgi:hypothetical protein
VPPFANADIPFEIRKILYVKDVPALRPPWPRSPGPLALSRRGGNGQISDNLT